VQQQTASALQNQCRDSTTILIFQIISVTLPRASKDFALSNMASTSKLTECMDICIDIPFTCEDFLLEERGGAVGLILSAIATTIRGLRLLISIP